MKRWIALTTLALALIIPGCKQSPDGYKVTLKILRQNTLPAEGFNIDVQVIGKSELKTYKTNSAGLVEINDLPFPDAKNQLRAVFHYFNGKKDGERDITYPFIESDKLRLKDTQYIPNNATPEPQ